MTDLASSIDLRTRNIQINIGNDSFHGGGGGLYMKNEKANYRDADLACSDSPLVDPHHLAYYRTSGCGCVSCSQSNQPETVAEIDHRAHTIDAPLTSHPISASPNGPD